MMGACGMHGEIVHPKYCLRNVKGRIHFGYSVFGVGGLIAGTECCC